MARFCLIPEAVTRFKQALIDGTLNPEQMGTMTSADRQKLIAGVVGDENAQLVNAQFESKLLLKNQKAGMITWANKVMGNTQVKRDIISKIERLDNVLTPEKQDMFLKDLVDTKLGVNVTAEEAGKISELANTMKENYETRFTDPNKTYARTYKQLLDYIAEKRPTKKGFLGFIQRGVANVVGLQRAVQTGFDISSALRQAAPYFGRKEWFASFGRALKYAASQRNFDELEINMYSNKNWDVISPFRKELGLTQLGEKMTQREEQFQTDLSMRIPVLNASQRFFTGMLNDLRFNRMSNTINALEKRGINISKDPQQLKALAEVIGIGTGRGQLGRLEPAANQLATGLFAPRYIASRVELITSPVTKSGIARKEAAKSLATMAGVATALIFGLKHSGVDVETDWRSSAFGRARVGNTRIDLTFGMGQYIRLLGQLSMHATKTQTGEIKELDTGEYGSRTTLDVISEFFAGKMAPIPSLALDIASRQERFGTGAKLGLNVNTLKRLGSMWEPLLVSDTMEAYRDASGQEKVGRAALAGALSLIGVGVQTYGGTKQKLQTLFNNIPDNVVAEFNRLQSSGNAPTMSDPEGLANIKDFKTKVSSDTYNQFLNELKSTLPGVYQNTMMNSNYLGSSDKDKASALDHFRDAAIQTLLDKYGYEKTKTKKTTPWYSAPKQPRAVK